MAIIINHSLDELQLLDLQDQGYTTLALYYSNSPEGPYVNSNVTPSPATLADAVTALVPYIFEFAFGSGNASQWFKIVATDGATTSSLSDSQAFHGGGGTNLQTIRQRIGKLTHTMLIGETTSAGAGDGSTAIADYAKFRRYRDDYFGGQADADGWIFNRLDTDEWTIINNWTQSSGTFNFSIPYSTAVGDGTTFEIMARWTPDEYRDAINWAIVNSYPVLSKPIIDTGMLTEEDIFEYPIPNSMKILNKVEIESTSFSDSEDTRTRGMPFREIAYYEIDDGLNRKIGFKRELDDGRRIRLTGTTMLSQVYNDSDFVEVIDPQVDIIVYLAAHRLYALLANTDASTDVQRFNEQAMYFRGLYEEAKRAKSSRRKPRKLWGHDARWSSY